VTDLLVDQVLVLTTSQQHEEGIRAAITAGKDVYCEWPLTPHAAKSAELATPRRCCQETGEKIQTTSPDELLMHGTLADGGLFSIHIEGGKLSGSGVQIDITGDAGDLKITNTSAFGGVDEDFIVTGAQGDSKLLEHLPIPAEYEWFPRAGLQTGVAELGDLYVALSRDLASGTQAVPTFHDAVWQQQLFEQIQDSSETGKRINL